MNSIATAISNGRTDTSFVDDLNALRGTVNSRVALLLRSIEVHPLQLRCVVLSRTHPSTFPFSGTTAHACVFDMAAGARRCYERLCANSLKNTSPRRMKLRRAVLAHLTPFLLSRRNKSARKPSTFLLMYVTSPVSRPARRPSHTRGCFRHAHKPLARLKAKEWFSIYRDSSAPRRARRA